MQYSDLCTQIQAYTENTFSTTELNVFIVGAEQRIYNSVQLPDLRKSVTLTATISSPYLNCPDDFLSGYSLAVIDTSGNYNYLLNKDINFMRAAYPSAATLAMPKYYALYGPQATVEKKLRLIMAPTPDSAYQMDFNYFYYPVSITAAQDGHTWLGDEFESVLLYGSLLEAYTYLKGDQDMMQVYRNRYDEALLLLKQLGDGKNRQDAYRSGQVRQAVK